MLTHPVDYLLSTEVTTYFHEDLDRDASESLCVQVNASSTAENRGGGGGVALKLPRSLQNYLLVYKEGEEGTVSEAEVAALCEGAEGQLLTWHAAIGTALCSSANPDFVNDVIARVRVAQCLSRCLHACSRRSRVHNTT